MPLKRMGQDEMARLLTVETEMEKVVVGQREGVSAICKALRRSRADLKDPKRPIGAFLLLGPTGVGKTLLAKTLAEQMFGDTKSLIHLDMSEYMEKFNVSRLIGSPPGYVGYEEGGQLTEKVRRNPYSVVLFDEIEKAHPDIWNLLLQILEEGKLTDNTGPCGEFPQHHHFDDLERRLGHDQAAVHARLFAHHRRRAATKRCASGFWTRPSGRSARNF